MTIPSSIVLASDEPAALAAFYADLIGVQAEPGLSSSHWRLLWPPGGWLEIYAPSGSRPQPRSEGRLALCLQRSAQGGDPMAALSKWVLSAVARGPPSGSRHNRNPSVQSAGCWIRRAIG